MRRPGAGPARGHAAGESVGSVARTGRALGEDGLQALQLALTAVRRALEPFADRLTWTGEPGELGLPEPIPDYFGGEFRRRLERLVHLETEREAQRLKEAALR
jgi:hypothetical protein